MRIGSSTNIRTAIGSFIYGMPAGDTAATFYVSSVKRTLALTGVLNSLVFDFITRARLAGLHLDYHVLEQNPLPPLSSTREYGAIAAFGAALSLPSPWFAPQQLQLGGEIRLDVAGCMSWTEAEQTRHLAILNSLITLMYGLNCRDLRRIIENCDLSCEVLRTRSQASNLDPKGFWRVDRDKHPELRHTVLTLIAFHDLEAKIEAAGGDREKGIEAFVTQNHGEGWLLPETLRLSDYGLGHDDRAKEPQVVASRLGPRFYDWQLVQATNESWGECHMHARNLLGGHGYAMLLVDLIRRRVAHGENYLDLLTDNFIRALTGKDDYLTILVEIRALQVLPDDAYWTLVDDLHNDGYPDQDGYFELLDKLHAHGLLDDLDYSRRRNHNESTSKDERLPLVAEEESAYDAEHKQKDLFD